MPPDRNRYCSALLLVGLFCFSPLFLICPDSNMVMAQTPDARKAEADQLLTQGVQQAQTSDYLRATQSWEKALAIYQEIKDRNGQANVLGNLGIASDSQSQYEKAITFFNQALFIYREVSDRNSEANTLGSLGNAYQSLLQYEKAIEFFNQALPIYQEVKDRHSEAWVLSKLGLTYKSLLRYDKATILYGEALSIYREISDRDNEANILNNLGNVYKSLLQGEKAISFFNQALTIYREVKDRNGEALALRNLGFTYYDVLSQHNKAIEYFNQALIIFRELKDRDSEAETLINLGNSYRELSEYDKAITFSNQALLLFRETKALNGEGETLNNLGITYELLSQYDQAIGFFNQALSVFRELKDRRSEARVLMSLGIAYDSLSQYDKSIDFYKQALSIFWELKDRHGEAEVLGNLGNISNTLSMHEEASELFDQASSIFRELKDHSSEAGALNGLGIAYQSLLQYDKAIILFGQALHIFQEIKNRNGEAVALASLGNAYGSIAQYDKEIALYQQALLTFQDIGNLRGQGNTLRRIGQTQLERDQVTAAETTLFKAVAVWESLRPGLSDSSKVSLFETQKRTYEFLQTALIMQNKTESALAVTERGRARAFVELLASRQQSKNQDKSEQTGMPIIQPLSLEGIRQIAKLQNATIVEYSILPTQVEAKGKKEWSDATLAIWVITPNGQVTTRKVDLTPLKIPLADLVTNSRDALGVRAFPQRATLIVKLPEGSQKQATERQKQRSQQLHQLLIDPIADLLPKNENDRVIFIPQQELFLVPFPALQDANGKYLIEKHTILTAPSIQVLDQTHQLQQQRQNHPAAETLVVGNPLMPIVTPYPGEPPQQLNPLPGAEAEAKAIAPLLNTQALTGTQGNKAVIKQKMPNARIIHLATHGLLDDLRGLGSAIALAPDHPGIPNDGLLTAEEILDLKLSADLVVLSACDTGRGRITGDGVIGLSRSFISAGVPSLIVSLWAVPDAPTAALMTEFYTNWQVQKLDKAQALRQAMLTTMKTHPNPRDWAAFTLIGESQ